VVFRENRHRTSIFHCKSCAKTGIQSCAKSDSGAKFSLKITGRFSFMFQQPFSIAAGLGGIYLSLALGIGMFILAGIALVGFMAVRVWRWWMHG
jgi:hypothetical protein